MAMKTSLRAFVPLRNAQFSVSLTAQSFRAPVIQKSLFHTSRASYLVLGEKYLFPKLEVAYPRIPPNTLMESGPTDRVDLQKEIGSKKSLIM
jgi:hypothetical protein